MPDLYNQAYKLTDAIKLEFNHRLALLSLSLPNRNKAIILDHSELVTTRHLQQVGYIPINIYVPNTDNMTYKLMNETAETYGLNINLYRASLGSFLDIFKYRNMKESVTTFWNDTSVGPDGNRTRGIFPLEDIESYFKFQYPADESVFAITLPTKRACTSERSRRGFQQIIDIAENYGYKFVEKYRTPNRRGSVQSILYRCSKVLKMIK